VPRYEIRTITSLGKKKGKKSEGQDKCRAVLYFLHVALAGH